MKLRSQLILAFLVLAVLPLAGIVGYSYVSSANAFRAAVQAETLDVARQISVGLRRTREDLQRYVGTLGMMLPFDDPQYVDREALVDQLLRNLGDSANFVEVLEFVPAGAPEPRVVGWGRWPDVCLSISPDRWRKPSWHTPIRQSAASVLIGVAV